MSSPFEVDLEGFKKQAGEFLKALPTASLDGLENGMKCLNLAYLNLEPLPADGSYEQIIAVSTLEFAARKYFYRHFELVNKTHH